MLKLFVWDDVLEDYSSGLIVALAHDVDEARRVVMEGLEDYQRAWVGREIADDPKVYDTPVARVIYGGG